MRKKLLSLLTVLCLVLGMLPATAMAVELTDEQKDALLEQGYTEEEIAELEAEDKVLVISEDTEIDEDYDGLILIVASCNVTIKGASIGVGVVILPGAADTTVTLTEAATVNAVVVLEENAEVVTEADTTVTYLTVAAPNAVVTIAGSVERYTLTEDAAGTESTISGSVETMTTDAPDTTTTVAEEGTVGDVNVGETATGTTINNNGTINTVNDEGGNATVNGNAPTSSEEEEEDEEEEEEEEEATEEEEEEINFDQYPIPQKTIAEKAGESIVAAPLDDHGISGMDPYTNRNGTVTATADTAANGLADKYTAETSAITTDSEGNYVMDVVVTGRNVIAHGNSTGQGGCFVGFAIPVYDGYKYTFERAAVTTSNGTTTVAVDSVEVSPNGYWYDDLGQLYASFYFAGNMSGGDFTDGEGELGTKNYQYTITITENADAEEGKVETSTGAEDGESLTLIVNVTYDVTAARTGDDDHVVWTDDDYKEYKGTGEEGDDVPADDQQPAAEVITEVEE